MTFCKSALDKQRLIVKNGIIQRQFIPSQIFVKIINTTINKKILIIQYQMLVIKFSI